MSLLRLVSSLLLASATVAATSPRLGSAVGLDERASTAGYADPNENGGGMLTVVEGTFPAGLGEPLNVILSAESDKEVLVRSLDNGGFLNYMLSANLGEECTLGQGLGNPQQANVGDGRGVVDEDETLRWNFGDPYLGTCRETFDGGLHHRYWIQNSTGAYFMAASVEMDLASGHDIVPNGYNLGRDYLVGNLTGKAFDDRSVSNQSLLIGQSTYNNYTYETTARWVSGLLKNSSEGVNHYVTVEAEGFPAIDGLVAVLTVKILKYGERTGAGFATIVFNPLLALAPLVLSLFML